MLRVTCTLTGTAPLSFGGAIRSEKTKKESHDAFEERTWQERAHVDEHGELYIPAMALKKALEESAKYIGETIPGKGMQRYTKRFERGVLVTENLMLGVTLSDVEKERLFVPSDGVSGGGKRVWKNFPTLRSWSCEAVLIILDELIIENPDRVREYLENAGQFIGMGRFRPERKGFYGRFKVSDFSAEPFEG